MQEGYKLTISLDYDGTLAQSTELQEFTKELISKGYKVMITTRRADDPESVWYDDYPPGEVYDLALKLGIRREDINFLDGKFKHTYFSGKSDIVHIDDEYQEVILINYSTYNNCKAFLIGELEKFKKYINEFESEGGIQIGEEA